MELQKELTEMKKNKELEELFVYKKELKLNFYKGNNFWKNIDSLINKIF